MSSILLAILFLMVLQRSAACKKITVKTEIDNKKFEVSGLKERSILNLPVRVIQMLNKKVKSEPNKLKREADKTRMMAKFK